MQTLFSHSADPHVKKDFLKRIKAILEEVMTAAENGESDRTGHQGERPGPEACEVAKRE